MTLETARVSSRLRLLPRTPVRGSDGYAVLRIRRFPNTDFLSSIRPWIEPTCAAVRDSPFSSPHGPAFFCACSLPHQGAGPVAVQRSDWTFHDRPGVELTTQHYLIRTTCKSPTLLKAIPDFLESCWTAYAELLPSQTQPSEPLKTYLFQNRSEWEAFTEDFAPARADVYKKIRSGGYSERGTTVSHYSSISATLSILAHEGFHQFLELTRGRNIPPWLNEGLACNFESFELDADNRPVFQPSATPCGAATWRRRWAATS